MAESSLTLGWADLKQSVGFFLGYGSTIGNWSAAQITEIEDIVQSGYRRVMYPPSVIQGAAGHKWSFLQPTTTLAVVADDGDYDLPDDLGSVVGGFHYAPDVHKAMIREVPTSVIVEARSASDTNGDAYWFAVRWKASTGAGGQRQEVLFYPEFDTSFTLYYTYDAFQGELSDSCPYPLGGMKMSELHKESCLAAAEERRGDSEGLHNRKFGQFLADMIARDLKNRPSSYGSMGAPAELGREVFRRGNERYGGAYSITYGGDQI